MAERCEHMISKANDIMNPMPLRTLLSDKELEMLVVLKMNRKFMEYLHLDPRYKQVIDKKFCDKADDGGAETNAELDQTDWCEFLVGG